MVVRRTVLDIFDAPEHLTHLAEALLLLQERIDVPHLPRQDGLTAIAGGEAPPTTPRLLVLAKVAPVALDFGNVGMRRPILLSHDRVCLLHGLLVLVQLSVDQVLTA